MFSLVIWWVGIILEALILWRGIVGKTLRRYPFFSTYNACLLAQSCFLFVISLVGPQAYAEWFWRTQFLTLGLGCGIILEIFQHVLSPYRGAEKLARGIGLAVFGAVLSFAAIYPYIAGPASVPATGFEFERDLRFVQAIFLFGVLGVVLYYRIELGKNMKALVFGYGLYIATSLASLAIRSHAGPALRAMWETIPPLSFAASNFIWAVGMWSYHPNLAPQQIARPEGDYGALAARTRNMMGEVSAYVEKAVRS